MKLLQKAVDALDHIRPDQLTGRGVIITGGGSGFGRGLAIMCVAAGAKVVIGDLNIAGMEGTAKLCEGLSGSLHFQNEKTNITSRSGTEKMFEFAENVFGKPADVVVANAGMSEAQDFDTDIVETNELGRYGQEPLLITLDVDCSGALLTMEVAQEFWERSPPTESDERKIIFLASTGAVKALPGATVYGAAKHGVLSYWTIICAKLRRDGGKPPFTIHQINPYWSLTGIVPEIVLFGIAGLDLVEPDTVSGAMLALIRDVRNDENVGTLNAIFDHKEPMSFSDLEHSPFDWEFYKTAINTVRARQKDYQGAAYYTQRNQDMLAALGFTQINLAALALGSVFLLWQLGWIWATASPVSIFVFGIFFAALTDAFELKKLSVNA